MSLSLFKVLPKNPNGRGGCACSPHGRRADCTGPYAVFTATEAWDPRNPSIVVGYQCLTSAARKCERTAQGAKARASFLESEAGAPYRPEVIEAAKPKAKPFRAPELDLPAVIEQLQRLSKDQ